MADGWVRVRRWWADTMGSAMDVPQEEEVEYSVVYVDGVLDQVGPHGSWCVRVAADGACELGDNADGALGDGVEVVVVRQAHSRGNGERRPE